MKKKPVTETQTITEEVTSEKITEEVECTRKALNRKSF